MLCTRKRLSQAIGWHISRIEPFDLESCGLHFLAHPELVNIHMAQFGLKDRPLAHKQIDSLLIIAVDNLGVVRVELNELKQALHPIIVPGSVADSQEFGLGGRSGDGSLLPSEPLDRATE
jgi:hypothetical protein